MGSKDELQTREVASESTQTEERDADAPGGAAKSGEDAPTGSAPDVEAASTAPQRDGGGAAHPAAAWGEPIARFDRRWLWLETRLVTFVLMWQLVALVSWVLLAGLASPPGSGGYAGIVFRGAVAAVLFSTAAWFGARRLSPALRQTLTLAGLVLGVAMAPLCRNVGVVYFDNLRGWLQEGSTLTLMGGLRGLGTRLTLWLALLGGSLATAAGKHIHVDLLFRALPKRLRLPAAVLNACAAAAVCLAAAWGFVDHIAIESFHARADDAAGAKVARVLHGVGDHAFLTRKQLGLDLRTLPRVLAGDRYDDWLTAADWNAWVKDAGFEGRYPAADVQSLVVPDDAPPHVPFVISPDGEPTRGALVHSLGLVFPFGLVMIALRFLLRALLTVSGHISVDPDEAHKEDLRAAAAASGGGA
jgi:TRAP-type C4-dicarboxylate transport system permease small subunit